MQVDREKQNYDYENVQTQLDKSLGQVARIQKEQQQVQMDADRFRDKYEKSNVS